MIRNRPKRTIKLALVHKHARRVNVHQDDSLLLQIRGMIDEIKKKKSQITIDEIGKATNGVTPQCILIEGAPGIGKSTFAWNLCRRWGKGELLAGFDLVILVQLRNTSMRKAKCLSDIFAFGSSKSREELCSVIEEDGGKDVMILFEGYDELSELQRSESSIFQQILRKELLPQSTILVTSRPISTNSLPPQFSEHIDQHVEIVGFTAKDIQEYVSSACEDQMPELVKDLQLYMKEHPFVASTMYNPLHCSIVTELYLYHWEINDKTFAPNSLTELYYCLLRFILMREHGVKMGKLEDLPKNLFEQLMKLTELAAKGIEERQYVFDNVPCDGLGLMQSIEEQYPFMSTSYSFNHLTLQEFLSSVFWSQLPPNELMNLLTRQDLFPLPQYLANKKHTTITDKELHWPVLLFLAGSTKFAAVISNLVKVGKEVAPRLCQLLFEAQSPPLVSEVFCKREFSISYHEMNSQLEWFVVGYCIAHSHSTASWSIKYNSAVKPNHTVACLQMLSKGLHYSSAFESTQLTSLEFVTKYDTFDSLDCLPILNPQGIRRLSLRLTDQSYFPSEGVLHHLHQYCTGMTSLLLGRSELLDTIIIIRLF